MANGTAHRMLIPRPLVRVPATRNRGGHVVQALSARRSKRSVFFGKLKPAVFVWHDWSVIAPVAVRNNSLKRPRVQPVKAALEILKGMLDSSVALSINPKIRREI